MEGMHGSFRFIFLKEGKDGVDDDYTEDRPAKRGHAFARLHEVCRERQGDGDPEQHGEKVSELVEESSNQWIVTRLLQNIGTIPAEPLPCLFGRQAAFPGFQACEDFSNCELMER